MVIIFHNHAVVITEDKSRSNILTDIVIVQITNEYIRIIVSWRNQFFIFH
jgi:hypothetical protein